MAGAIHQREAQHFKLRPLNNAELRVAQYQPMENINAIKTLK